MKIIGFGGMSWESSSEYYRIINEEVKLKQRRLSKNYRIFYQSQQEDPDF